VNAHVNEELVAHIEGLVAALTRGPVAGEVLALALVNVRFLKVANQLILLLEHLVTVNPATDVRLVARLLPIFVQEITIIVHVKRA